MTPALDRHVVTLYRYFMWADRMREAMERMLDEGGPRLLVSSAGDLLFLYTSYYHSALYIVIEGWDDLGLKDPEIDQRLLQVDNVALLKRFRHGTFHFQREYLDSRIIDLVSTEGVAEWIRSVRDAFWAWFERFFVEVESRHPKGGPDGPTR